jgi:hypothetical protein
VEFVTEPAKLKKLGHLFEQISPGDGVIVHTCDVQGDQHKTHALVGGDVVVQLLDEDDMEGFSKRLHMMEHFRADHEGKSPMCGIEGHGPPLSMQAIFIGGIGMHGPIPPDKLLEAIKALASASPELRDMLREEFGDAS